MNRIHIEPKSRNLDRQTLDIARAFAASHPNIELSAASLTASTGLPVDVSEAALLALSSQAPCRLSVRDDGNLAFRFAPLPARAERGPLRALLGAIARTADRLRDPLLATFTLAALPPFALVAASGCLAALHVTTEPGGILSVLLFPMTALAFLTATGWALVGTLLVTAASFLLSGLLLIFLALALIALPFIEGLPKGGAGEVVLALVLGGAAVAFCAWFGLGLTVGTFQLWRDVSTGERAAWARTLWRDVGAFVFGPPRPPPPDPLADERRLVALITSHAGVITAADLMRTFGWSPDEADRDLVRVLLDYGGDIAVSSDGGIVYIFPALSAPASVNVPAPPAPAPMPAPPPFFGHHRAFVKTTLWLLLPVFFGALLSPVVGFELLPDPESFFRDPRGLPPPPPDAEHTANFGPIAQGLGAWPHLGLLAVLALRSPLWFVRLARYRKESRRRRILDAALSSPGGAWLPVADASHPLVASLDGHLDIDAGLRAPDGTDARRVRFDAIRLSLEAAARLRAAVSPRRP
jgi:hypothetical protein